MTLTPDGESVTELSRFLAAQGHTIGLTDSDELREVEGLDVRAGVYLTCGRCGELWRVKPNGDPS